MKIRTLICSLVLMLSAESHAGDVLPYQVLVEGEGRPVYLIPGLASPGLVWDDLATRLRAAGYQTPRSDPGRVCRSAAVAPATISCRKCEARLPKNSNQTPVRNRSLSATAWAVSWRSGWPPRCLMRSPLRWRWMACHNLGALHDASATAENQS